MKIAMIGQKGIPAVYGGVERHVEELAKNLVKSGHEVFVYTRRNYTDKNLKEFEGVKLISLPNIKTKHLDAISHTFMACLHALRQDFDIIHFHSIGPSSLIWIIKLFRQGVPVIATFHTKCYEHKKWGFFARLYLKFGEAITCKLPDKTIIVSNSLADYAVKKYHPNAVYIPNGVTFSRMDELNSEIKQWGLQNGNYIVAISRLIAHKGLAYLIKAYQSINTDKKLVIVGDGSYTEEYVKFIKDLAGNNPNIIFTGCQSGQTLRQLFSNAYLFVQPSESEGLSIALLEAMSYKRAIIASDIPENREALADCGFYFKNKDTQNLAERMRELLDNPDSAKLKAEQGYIRAEKMYNWENITKQIIAVYEDLLWNYSSTQSKITARKSKFLSRAKRVL